MSSKEKINKSDQQWRAELTDEQFRITRQHGTERPGTGPYLHEKASGTYRCVCCGEPLFRSETKYDSGSGWPSFYAAATADGIASHEDRSHMMRRVEARCAKCDAHLGHIFPDGPQPTGLRYCINGASLTLDKDP